VSGLPLTLAISTASPALSLALFEGDRVIAHDHRVIGRGHAEALVPAIAALLGYRQPALVPKLVLVDIGPGSFTGIRIGIAAARALGVAWGVPVRGFSGTSLVAAAAFAADPALTQVAAVIDAGRGQRFVEVLARDFSGGTIATVATDALAAESLALAGDAPDDIPTLWRGQPDCRFAALVPDAFRSLPPTARYVRPPDAILPL
jgi:tRNA threonylcarbamoyl adenosine modification protein YeaZ